MGGLKGNVAIAYDTHIQHAIGGQGDDVLIGNDDGDVLERYAGNNFFLGGKGGDVMTGGPGHNTYVYSDPSASSVQHPDLITDFKTGQDVIHLSPMLANHSYSQLPTLTHIQTVESGLHVQNLLFSEPAGEPTDLGGIVVTLTDTHPDMLIKVIGDVNESDIHYMDSVHSTNVA